MGIIDDFISRENRRFNFKIGGTLASALSGLIAGSILASIIWELAVKYIGLI